MRPTILSIFVFAIIIVISLAILLIKDEWSIVCFILTGVFMGCFVLDGLGCRKSNEFSVRWRLPNTLYIGSTDYLELEVRVPSNWPVRQIETSVDFNEKLEAIDDFYFNIDPSSSNLLKIDLTPKRRGQAGIETIWLRWSGRLGLASWTEKLEINQQIPIIPNIRAVAKDALKFSSRDALFGIKPQWQLGDGSEFDALREYVPGFDSRAIDWKSSARHHKLICKEFQTERNHQIILAFDTGHLMIEPVKGLSKMDHAINAGLLLSYLSLKNGDKVGVMGFNSKVEQYLPPVSSVHNFQKIQQVCAGIEYSTEEANYTLAMTELLSRLNRRSLIILITDFVDTVTADLMIDNMARLSKKHLIVFVSLKDKNLYKYANKEIAALDDLSGAVLAQDFILERDVVIERLARLGIQCVDTTIENLRVEILNKYIHIKLREMI